MQKTDFISALQIFRMKKLFLLSALIAMLFSLTGCSLFSKSNLDHSLVASFSQPNTSITSSGTISIYVPEYELVNSIEKTLLVNNQNIPFYLTMYKNDEQYLAADIQVKMQDKLQTFKYIQHQDQQYIRDEIAWTPLNLRSISPIYQFLFNQEQQKNWFPSLFSKGIPISKKGEVELKDGDDTFSTTAYQVNLDQNQFNTIRSNMVKKGLLSENQNSNQIILHKGNITFFKEKNFIRAMHYDLEFSLKTGDEQTISFQVVGDSVFRFFDSSPTNITIPASEQMYPSFTEFLTNLIRKNN